MPLLVMQRICWNTKEWQKPSNSSKENAYPRESGFGVEEWNFQLDDSWNGFIFPYMYSIPSEKKLKEHNGKFDVGFFTRHDNTKQWLFIGIHRNVQLIESDEYPKIRKHFKNTGIFERRANEISSVANGFSKKSALEEIKNGFSSLPESMFKLKSPIENIKLLPQPILIEKPSNHRFKTFSYVDEFPVNLKKLYPQKRSTLTEDGYYRESPEKLKIIIPKHNQLSNSFCAWLQTKNIEATQEQNYVDVLFNHDVKSYIAELKIVYGGVGITKSIREALGQLLEYNYYPNRTCNQQWMIILDQKPTVNDLSYIDNLIKNLELPLRIGWQSNKDFIFHPEWEI